MIAAILLALACATAYGVSDFLGGRASARLKVATATLLIYAVATVAAGAGLLVAGGRWSVGAFLWAALAGLLAIAGTLALYAAMVGGPVSLATPIVGTLESAVPVIAAVLLGQRMTGLIWLAIALAAAGGALVPLRLGEGERLTARPAALAIAGGLLFGGSILALDRAPRDSGLIPAVFESAVGVVVLGVILGAARFSARLARLVGLLDAGPDASPARPSSRVGRLAPALAAGILLGVANALLVLALRSGPLAVVTVLADLYPVAAVVLAWLVLRERLSSLQLLGVALAVGASALFALA